MEFSDFSDDEPSVTYDDYVYTPFTDPSAITPLWKEHFQRSVNKRNPEVKRAFDVECSIYHFMNPELTRADITKKVTRLLKNKTKLSKKPFKLAFTTLVGSDNCREVVNTEVGPFHKECVLKSELNEPQEKNSDVTVEEKICIDTNNVTKSYKKTPITSTFLDEKFSDFKESNKFPCDNTDLKPRKVYPAKQPKIKSKMSDTIKGEILECNERILNNEKNTDYKCTQRTEVDKTLNETNTSSIKKIKLMPTTTKNNKSLLYLKIEHPAKTKQHDGDNKTKTKTKYTTLKIAKPFKLVPLKIIKTEPKGKTESPIKIPSIIEQAEGSLTTKQLSKPVKRNKKL